MDSPHNEETERHFESRKRSTSGGDSVDLCLSEIQSPLDLGLNCSYSDEVENLRLSQLKPLIYPELLIEEIPLTLRSKTTVIRGRDSVAAIVHGLDHRLIVVVGPSSVHDPHAALEYARKLKVECHRFKNDLHILMRLFIEKPRMGTRWNGLIHDPDLDETYNVNKGLRIGRRLLADITGIGVSIGYEYVDAIIPQYLGDLISWGVIGPRTFDSQLHKDLASGLSMPIGLKSGSCNEHNLTVQACIAAKQRQVFLGITKQGLPATCHTLGNPDVHYVLADTLKTTESLEQSVGRAIERLDSNGCIPRLVIDCSYGNTPHENRGQRAMCEKVSQMIRHGSDRVIGVIIESYLYEGSQALAFSSKRNQSVTTERNIKELEPAVQIKAFSMTQNTHIVSQLRYGVSVTDRCAGWPETVEILNDLANAVQQRRQKRLSSRSIAFPL